MDSNNTATDLTGKVIEWDIRDDWTKIGDSNIWYRATEVSKDESKDQEFYIFKGDDKETTLKNGYVTVNVNITKDMVDGKNNDGLAKNPPTITITAAAVQSQNMKDVQTAFNELSEDFRDNETWTETTGINAG